MMKRMVPNMLRLLMTAALLSTLAACGPDTRELQAYIDEVMARPGGRIEPLPEIQPAPSFVYHANERRSPFMPDTPEQAATRSAGGIQRPDPNRPREYLEQFSLDTLEMVGTLSGRNGHFGLVQTADGLVHRVTVGNHLGQNYGRVTAITESEIELVEIIPDGLGGFIERPAGIGLSD
jgi:type IV pilus assembly protein PilP